jgi:predicted O-methyltransferase YrrM
MSDNKNSIHEFDVNLICEYFSQLERQGPGSPEMTVKALSFIDNLTAESQILDLGCRTGGQTMVLAQHSQGNITGLYLFPKFIDQFNANAAKLNLQDRVKGIVSCPANAIENGTVNQKLCRTHTYGKTKRGFDTVDCNRCRTVCPMCYGDNGIISNPL